MLIQQSLTTNAQLIPKPMATREIKRSASVDSLTAPLRREDALVILGNQDSDYNEILSRQPVSSKSRSDLGRRRSGSHPNNPQRRAMSNAEDTVCTDVLLHWLLLLNIAFFHSIKIIVYKM